MSNVMKFEQPIRVGSLSSDPSSPQNGQIYYNTSSNVLRQYINGAWQDITAGSVSLTGQSLTSGNIIVGNGSNLSASVTPSGDVTISNTGVTTITAGAVDNSKISAGAAIAFSKLAALASGNILVGNGSNVATSVPVSGEATISNAGVVTLSNAAVIAKVLTAYASSPGTVSSSDSILSAIQKIDGNDQLKLARSGGTMTGNINMGGNSITNMADPVNPQDGVTKFYADNLVAALSWKTSVRVATTAPLSIATDLEAGDNADGVTFLAGDRILVKDQASPAQNGIYIISSSGPGTRSTDMDSWSEVYGAAMLVTEGTVNGGSKWVNQNIAGGTLGTTPITFAAFSIAGTVNGTGTSGYVAYWNGTSSLTAEQYLSQIRGGTGGDSSAATGIAHVSSGVWSYSQIVNADVSASAAIAYSKLALSNSIVNADINAAAAIAYSKLNLSASIVNADVAAAAAIAYSKLAALTANRALQSDGSGFVSVSAVTSTELGYVSGVTSAIQTQFTGKANQALDNLASTAVNADIIPATDNTVSLGSSAKNNVLVHARGIRSNSALTVNANDGASNVDIRSSKVRRSKDGSSFVEQEYIDSEVLAANTTTTPASLTYAFASFEGCEIVYKMKQATSAFVRIGTFRVANDSAGSLVSYTDTQNETGDCEIAVSAAVNGSNIEISFVNADATKAVTMRADVKRFRA